MPIDLTKEQQEQLDRETSRPASIRDPRSNAQYVLIPTEQYKQMIDEVENASEQKALRRAAARGLGQRLAGEE